MMRRQRWTQTHSIFHNSAPNGSTGLLCFCLGVLCISTCVLNPSWEQKIIQTQATYCEPTSAISKVPVTFPWPQGPLTPLQMKTQVPKIQLRKEWRSTEIKSGGNNLTYRPKVCIDSGSKAAGCRKNSDKGFLFPPELRDWLFGTNHIAENFLHPSWTNHTTETFLYPSWTNHTVETSSIYHEPITSQNRCFLTSLQQRLSSVALC
jgi:hypothetical protein